MMTRAIQRRSASGAGALESACGPLLARVYAARGVVAPAELSLGLAGLAPVGRLQSVHAAAELLHGHVTAGNSIVVAGDFDADGATSTALVVRALNMLGHERVAYVVPDRFRHGYGLGPEVVALAQAHDPALIVTVDNGIASVAGVEAARDAGIDVLVTDHHLPPERLPAAAAIVNPNLVDEGFPSKHLAGVGVAFYLLAALAKRREDGDGMAGATARVAGLLDLVALGTVADVVPLDRNNRILVAQGLRRLRAGKGVVGIRALLEAAGRDPGRAVAADLGFAAGPRLNAAGRLDDMSVGIECLLTDDAGTAARLAGVLDDLNIERRDIEGRMQDQAMQAVETLGLADDVEGLPWILCLHRHDWHQGVVGLVASRVKERVQRPVVAFADGDDGRLKGSARSIPGLHIRDALAAVDARHPGLIERFGGHAMAAGLTLAPARLEAFSEALEQEVRRQLEPRDLVGTLLTDGELGDTDFTLATARALREAGPWGQAFAEPLFDGVFDVLDSRVLKQRHLKLKVQPAGRRVQLEAIAFNAVREGEAPPPRRLRLVYRLDVNHWQDLDRLQLVVEYLEPA